MIYTVPLDDGTEITVYDGGGRVYAYDREETEPCERCTPGCSIDHNLDPNDECETW